MEFLGPKVPYADGAWQELGLETIEERGEWQMRESWREVPTLFCKDIVRGRIAEFSSKEDPNYT